MVNCPFYFIKFMYVQKQKLMCSTYDIHNSNMLHTGREMDIYSRCVPHGFISGSSGHAFIILSIL